MEELVKFIPVIIALIILTIREKRRQAQNFLSVLKEMVDDYFKDVDAEQKKYHKGWSSVESWKQNIERKVDKIKELYQKEGESEKVTAAFDELSESLENGLRVIQDGENPLVVQKGKGHDGWHELSIKWKILFAAIFLLPCLWLYLVLSGIGYGILILTIAFSFFIFPKGTPFQFLEQSDKFRFKHFIGILLISTIGYYLNRWTYAQAENVQIAVTVGLPIIYGLIYYVLKHKKVMREL